jgi:hypothetical protein
MINIIVWWNALRHGLMVWKWLRNINTIHLQRASLLASLHLLAALLVRLRPCCHSPYRFSAMNCLMTSSLMILECSSRREWRILAARVQALKTRGNE